VFVATLYALFWPDPAGSGSGPPGSDKAVHVLLFGALAATARWRFGSPAWVLPAVVTYAVVSEVVQALWLSARAGDLRDLVADLLGIAAGWLLAHRRLAPR
jgi:VanZ family protein